MDRSLLLWTLPDGFDDAATRLLFGTENIDKVICGHSSTTGGTFAVVIFVEPSEARKYCRALSNPNVSTVDVDEATKKELTIGVNGKRVSVAPFPIDVTGVWVPSKPPTGKKPREEPAARGRGRGDAATQRGRGRATAAEEVAPALEDQEAPPSVATPAADPVTDKAAAAVTATNPKQKKAGISLSSANVGTKRQRLDDSSDDDEKDNIPAPTTQPSTLAPTPPAPAAVVAKHPSPSNKPMPNKNSVALSPKDDEKSAFASQQKPAQPPMKQPRVEKAPAQQLAPKEVPSPQPRAEKRSSAVAPPASNDPPVTTLSHKKGTQAFQGKRMSFGSDSDEDAHEVMVAPKSPKVSRCTYCESTGHISEKCPARPRHDEPTQAAAAPVKISSPRLHYATSGSSNVTPSTTHPAQHQSNTPSQPPRSSVGAARGTSAAGKDLCKFCGSSEHFSRKCPNKR